VVAEVQPGYVHGDRLVRAAMVVVAKPKSGTPTDKAR
jgi:molecular chaperone GrpE (heat shock protein)